MGVTIGSTVVETAGLGSATSGWSRTIEPLADGAVRWPSLTAALRELRETHVPRGGALTIALLAPLADVRSVVLPPLSADEARQILARHAARYFVAAREPQVIGTLPSPAVNGNGTGNGHRSGPRPLVAAAAAARVIEAIHLAAREAGWRVRTIVPAEETWRVGALAMWPDLRHGRRAVAVLRRDGAQLLQLQDGALSAVRRFGDLPSGGPAMRDALIQHDGVPPVGGCALLGASLLRDALLGALDGRATSIIEPPAKWEAVTASAEHTAAAFASRASGLELVSDSARRARQAWRAKATMIAAAAAVALLAVAAAIELSAAHRDLTRVQAERAALRPKVAALVALRDSAARTDVRLRELVAEADHATAWSDVLTTVTRALPRDAYLTAFRADGDSLVLEGVAHRAAGVFTAISDLPVLTGVRSAAPVRRDLGDRKATDAPERFAVAARIAPARDTTALRLPSVARRS